MPIDRRGVWATPVIMTAINDDTKFGSLQLSDGADVPDDIWDFASDDINGGSTIKTFPVASGDIYLSSSSASDTAVTVTVYYIDENWAAQSVDVALSGQTVVDAGVDGWDVNRMIVSGSTAALGNVYATTADNHTAGVPDDNAEVLAFARAGDGQTQQCLYTCPGNIRVRVVRAYINLARAGGLVGSGVVDIRIREFGKTWVVKRRYFPTTAVSIQVEGSFLVPAKSNVCFRATDISDIDTNITASMHYDLEPM